MARRFSEDKLIVASHNKGKLVEIAEMLTRFLSDPTSFPPVVQDETCARYMKAFPPERMADVEAGHMRAFWQLVKTKLIAKGAPRKSFFNRNCPS